MIEPYFLRPGARRDSSDRCAAIHEQAAADAAATAAMDRSELSAPVDEEEEELQRSAAEGELGLAAVDDSDSPPTEPPSCATELDADAD